MVSQSTSSTLFAEELESLRNKIAELQRMLRTPPPAGASTSAAAGAKLPETRLEEHPPIQEQHFEAGEGSPAEKPSSEALPALPHLLDHRVFGLALLNSDFRFVKINRTFAEMLGYAEEEDLTSLSLRDIMSEEDFRSCVDRIGNVLKGAIACAQVEKRILKKNRDARWVSMTFSLGNENGSAPRFGLAIIEDIQDRKQAEESLRREKQFSERVIHSSVDGIFAFNRQGIVTIWNPSMERIFGIGEAEILGRNVGDLVHFLRQIGEEHYFQDTLQGKTAVARNKSYYIPETGKRGLFEAYYSPVYDDAGEIAGGFAVIRDVTERRQAEESQLAMEERYRELFENAQDFVFTHDLEGHLTSANKALERIAGYTRDEVLKMKLYDLVAPDYLDVARGMVERQIAGEAPGKYELEILAKDHRRVALEINTRLIFMEGKPVAVQGIGRDITERKKSDEELQQANKKLASWVSELEQRAREMTLLSELGDMLRACLTTDEAYAVIVRIAQQIFPVPAGALYVIAPSRNVVEAVAIWGNTSFSERVFSPDECWALRRGRVHWVEDTRVGLLCKHIENPVPGGYLCVPMMAQGEALGILHLTQPENSRMTETKQRLAVAIAEHIAMALSNLKLHETLRSQSIRDSITGLFNKHFMEESLELELRRAVRNQRPLGIIMLELDQFGSLNETYGRDTAGTVLREIGTLLQTMIRKEDIACRFSGEKFSVILPQGGTDVTLQRAESLRQIIKGLQLKHRGQPLARLSGSIGIAIFPEHGRTVDTLLRAAEGALHRAMDEGGDRVIGAR
jgi:diguanylate cyclase (GGDEF)-like protein/PAS domain S-box-containing protein